MQFVIFFWSRLFLFNKIVEFLALVKFLNNNILILYGVGPTKRNQNVGILRTKTTVKNTSSCSLIQIVSSFKYIPSHRNVTPSY